MKISGSVCDNNGRRYSVNVDQIIEAEKGAFDDSYAEVISSPKKLKSTPEKAVMSKKSEKADK